MPKFTVTAATGLVLPAETLVQLTPVQLALRRHQVREASPKKPDGWLIANQPLSFKRGEVVKTKGDLPRVLAVRTDVPVEASAPSAPALVLFPPPDNELSGEAENQT